MTFGPNTYLYQREVAKLLFKNLGEFDFHDRMQAISCPTLILHGAADPLPTEAAQKIKQAIPNSKLVMIEKAGHFMFIEQPREVWDTIRDFLKKN